MRIPSFRVPTLSLLSLAFLANAAAAQSRSSDLNFEQTTLLQAPVGGQPDQERVKASLATLQIPFVANDGRLDKRVAYSASTFAGTVYVTRDGKIVYSLQAPGDKALVRGSDQKRPGWSLTETLVGSKPQPQGAGATGTHASYFMGNDPANWTTDIATYDSVALGEVWPGVDVRVRAHGRNAEKLFFVSPGASPARIRMQVAGARSLLVNSVGALVATTGLGEVTFTPPVAYQEGAGGRREVHVAYRVRGDRYGFRVGSYDAGLPLVIDPLLQSTFLGGSLDDRSFSLAVHPISGDVYVAGFTKSSDFPGTAGGANIASTGLDAFVARLSPDLTTLKQASYVGNMSYEFVDKPRVAIAVHPASGDIYVAGTTSSPNFPGTAGGAQPVWGGFNDAFVARLNADLNQLIQATYLGGSFDDSATALAIHPVSGDVYVAGDTEDFPGTPFPGTAGGAQPVSGDHYDGFVARLNASLTVLKQSTYLGGSDRDDANALAIRSASGDVYVAGDTASLDFPAVAGGAQPIRAGVQPGPGAQSSTPDAFVARLRADLTTIYQSTYLGGLQNDVAYALAIHPTTGDVYLAGETHSTFFPGTSSQHASDIGGADAFVARLSADLTHLFRSTFLGGRSGDVATSLAIHPVSGDVYAAGYTASDNFPGTAGGAIPDYKHPSDQEAFVSRLSSSLTTLFQSTYVGGNNPPYFGDSARGYGLAISAASGEVYVSGETGSVRFPGTLGSTQETSGGGSDAFVTLLTPGLEASPVLNAFVSFTPLKSTFKTTRPVPGCGFGTFSFTARLTNSSNSTLSHLTVKIESLTIGDTLQNADLGPGQAGDGMTIPFIGAYADRGLSTGESVDVPFIICLDTGGSFSFFVDVVGVAD